MDTERHHCILTMLPDVLTKWAEPLIPATPDTRLLSQQQPTLAIELQI